MVAFKRGCLCHYMYHAISWVGPCLGWFNRLAENKRLWRNQQQNLLQIQSWSCGFWRRFSPGWLARSATSLLWLLEQSSIRWNLILVIPEPFYSWVPLLLGYQLRWWVLISSQPKSVSIAISYGPYLQLRLRMSKICNQIEAFETLQRWCPQFDAWSAWCQISSSVSATKSLWPVILLNEHHTLGALSFCPYACMQINWLYLYTDTHGCI